MAKAEVTEKISWRASASIRSLKSLIRRYPAFGEVAFIIGDAPEPAAQSDRTSAIIAAAWLDTFLELVICTRLVGNNQDLFIGNGPLRDTSSKIQMLYALGLITEYIRDELNTIRAIRNVFAHTASLITFKTDEVVEACEQLWIPRQYPLDDPTHERDAKGKFLLSTKILWRFLGDQLRRKQPAKGTLLRRVKKLHPELFPTTLPGISPSPSQAGAQKPRRCLTR